MRNKEIEKFIQIKCKKCGHEWACKGKLIQVTCPSCGKKTPRKKLES